MDSISEVARFIDGLLEVCLHSSEMPWSLYPDSIQHREIVSGIRSESRIVNPWHIRYAVQALKLRKEILQLPNIRAGVAETCRR